MGKTERLAAILDMVSERRHVSVEEIVSQLGVSPATARRDLDLLSDRQLLLRTRGGGVRHDSVSYDLPFRYKKGQFSEAKETIARAASGLVLRGDVVGLCGGTTTTAIASHLSGREDLTNGEPGVSLTVVTNALNIATQLAVRPHMKVVVTGGVVQPRSYELVGPYTDGVLSQITMDIALLGVNGIDPKVGATVFDESEAHINRLMAERATRAVIVATSQKIGRRAFATMGGPHLYDTLITDAGISSDAVKAFEDMGVTVIIAR